MLGGADHDAGDGAGEDPAEKAGTDAQPGQKRITKGKQKYEPAETGLFSLPKDEILNEHR